MPDGEPERDRQQRLESGPTEGDPLDRENLLEGKFEPQGEKKERDADFGKIFDAVDVRDGDSSGVVADDDARQNIPEDERLIQPSGDESADEPRENDENKIRCDAYAISFFPVFLLLFLHPRRKSAKHFLHPLVCGVKNIIKILDF
jgi:hypothetical protein